MSVSREKLMDANVLVKNGGQTIEGLRAYLGEGKISGDSDGIIRGKGDFVYVWESGGSYLYVLFSANGSALRSVYTSSYKS